MTEIEPGDCVEARIEMFVHSEFTATGGEYVVHPGTRTIVVAVSPPTLSACHTCRERGLNGLLLSDYPLQPYIAWCPCEWKKVGGSKEEHVKRFAEYLRERDAEVIKRLVEHLP